MQTTSLNAYLQIKKELGQRQSVVLDVIKYLKSPTNLEISKFLGIPINAITPRTNELVKKGIVKQSDKRVCKVSGKVVYTWRVV